MLRPDYSNSIVNLVSSIQSGMGGQPANSPLENDLHLRIQAADNVVMLMLDGFGYEYLRKNQHNTIFETAELKRLTSVFPTTTASAVTSYATGLTPAQHAITGWFMYLHDPGLVTAILPFMIRGSMVTLNELGITAEHVVGVKSVYPELARKSYVVSPDYIVDSIYSKLINLGAKGCGYETLQDMFSTTESIIGESKEKKYIYSYWSEFDALCHKYGVASDETSQHFTELARALEAFLDSVKGSNTLVLISADHGLLDTSEDKTLLVSQHPEIRDALLTPLCGEPRAAYCYVHPDKEATFVEYIEKHWSDYCRLYSRQQILDGQFYGPEVIHPELHRRVGDYVLLMNDNYIIKDRLQNEKPFTQIGVHGGLSEQELYVPLLVYAC